MCGEFRKYFVLFLFLLFSAFGCGTKHRATGSSVKNIDEKYSQLLGVSKEKISNHTLYAFIDRWYGTTYKYGGRSKEGVDCSGLASIFYKEVFKKEINGSSSAIYEQCVPVRKDDLHEGDLVFFKIDSKEISHVGIYLQNNKFVHASVKAGVIINDLNEDYYRKYFAGGGRVR